MSDNFLKEAFEAEAYHEAARNKRLLIIVPIASIIAVTAAILILRQQPAPDSEELSANSSPEVSVTKEKSEKPKDEENDNVDGIETQKSSSSISAPEQSQSTGSQQYVPPARSLNRASFITDGNKTLSNYSTIVELMTFPDSTPENEKLNRARKAISLDRQYFSQVSDLRGHLVWANVSSGPYMEATVSAEKGAAKISAGLTLVDYWVNNQSRASDLQSGLGMIGEGSRILLDFSSKLSVL